MTIMTTLRDRVPKNSKKFTTNYGIDNLYGWRLVLTCGLPLPVALFSLAFVNVSESLILFLSMIVTIGVCHYRTQFLIHEISHRTLMTNKRLENFIGYVIGLIAGVHITSYRKFHAQHHAHVGTDKDPQRSDYFPSGATRSEKILFLLKGLIFQKFFDYLNREIKQTVKVRNTGNSERQLKQRWAIITWAMATLSTQICIIALVSRMGENIANAMVFPIAAATVTLALARARSVAEHKVDEKFEQSEYTRSHSQNSLESLLLAPANFNFHVEHHLYPNLQSKHLPQISSIIARDISASHLNGSMLQTISDELEA